MKFSKTRDRFQALYPTPNMQTWVDPERGQGSRHPPGKSLLAIGFLRNTGANPSREAIDQLLLDKGFYDPLWNTLMTKK